MTECALLPLCCKSDPLEEALVKGGAVIAEQAARAEDRNVGIGRCPRAHQPVPASLDRWWFALREWSVPRARGASPLQEHSFLSANEPLRQQRTSESESSGGK